jgi:hypothetical protein
MISFLSLNIYLLKSENKVQAYNSTTKEVEAGGLHVWGTWAQIKWIRNHSEFHIETLSQVSKTKEKE